MFALLNNNMKDKLELNLMLKSLLKSFIIKYLNCMYTQPQIKLEPFYRAHSNKYIIKYISIRIHLIHHINI